MVNIYYFYGDEDFLIGEEISKLRERVFGTAGGAVERFTPDDTPADELVTKVCTAGLFASDRLVVLEDYEEEDLLKLLEQAGNIPSAVRVVIVAKKADKRTRLFKELQKKAEVREFRPFTEREGGAVVLWITARAASLSKKIDGSTAQLLNEISGPSLRQLSSEIEKLAAFCGKRGTIEKEDVEKLAVSGQLNAFALENALAERDLKGALSALDRAMRSKEPAHKLLARLASRLRTYLLIKSLRQKRVPRDRAVERLGINPYYYDRCLPGVERYTLDELARAFKTLSDTDLALKNTGQKPQLLMELMLADIMSGKRP